MGQKIYLKDYQTPHHWVDHVDLTFHLSPDATRVISRIKFRPNPDHPGQPLKLDGQLMKLIRAKIDGAPIAPEITDDHLITPAPDTPFVFEAEVEINPAANTALEGLYLSNGMFCTQCEAEGFRRVTYYPDRPDVMAPFDVRIESDLPVLLSNGNPGTSGEGWAEWSDPWPKPAYLFALVAGELHQHPGAFTTKSGRDVALNLYVRAGDEDKCDFGMEALIASMKWDEDSYGREYDLDVFNIVAVDDFNMGAMENKGLNIFNSSCVLANPATTTDAGFERIEAIIAHEYFHNWTGNRITCRDWFQLCLKEGLTVFRDQQFTSDLRSAPVKRIDDAIALRGRQFREDGGPLAHPVRPEEFVEINNFYTATVYEKGAEVIGMLKTLVGDDAYARALDLYFSRHDGQACTIEDWLQVFTDGTGRDLTQFKRWYAQAGTPRVAVDTAHSGDTLRVTLRQSTPPTPGQDEKLPQVIPFAIGALSETGAELLPTQMLELTEAEQSFEFKGISERPILSALRGFSAPVILEQQMEPADRLVLMAHDTDPFNRWEAGRVLLKSHICDGIAGGDHTAARQTLADALITTARDATLDPAFRALCLTLPSQDELAQQLFEKGATPDPAAIQSAVKDFDLALAHAGGDTWHDLYETNQPTGPYAPDATGSGMRAMANRVLGLISHLDGGAAARAQVENADNMTNELAGFATLLRIGQGADAAAEFYAKWRHERLVIDKWFSLQVACPAADAGLAAAAALRDHPDFSMTNPNRFRALFGALMTTPVTFHHASGQGYQLFGDALYALDAINPQLTARMCTGFEAWARYDPDRQAMMRGQMEKILGRDGVSRDTAEMLTRILG